MLSALFKSIIDADEAPVVVCDTASVIVYMNPSAVARYHGNLTGRSIMDCHNPASREAISRVLDWFLASPAHNRVFTSRNERENKDVYMIALRNETGELIGYYEKHEYRNPETALLYTFFKGE